MHVFGRASKVAYSLHTSSSRFRWNLEKRRFSAESSTLEFVADAKPTLAGVDPYNKLIDRNPDDNLIEVAEKRVVHKEAGA